MSDRKGIDLTLGRKNNNELVCFEIGPLPLRTRFPRRMIVIKEIRRERDSGVENSGLRRVLPGKSPAPNLLFGSRQSPLGVERVLYRFARKQSTSQRFQP